MTPKPANQFLLLVASIGLLSANVPAQNANRNGPHDSTVLFTDTFKGHLAADWYWVREHKEAWRTSGRGLEVLIEPGNMWGPQNDAKNILLRPAPSLGANPIQIEVALEHAPTNQYEQADLVWYFDDSNMVKIGEELVDGQLSVVMGREENDQTRTISITALKSRSVRLRMEVTATGITGFFQIPGTNSWTQVGQCELPKSQSSGVEPKVGVQFYQGVSGSGHWARVTEFRISSSHGTARPALKEEK